MFVKIYGELWLRNECHIMFTSGGLNTAFKNLTLLLTTSSLVSTFWFSLIVSFSMELLFSTCLMMSIFSRNSFAVLLMNAFLFFIMSSFDKSCLALLLINTFLPLITSGSSLTISFRDCLEPLELLSRWLSSTSNILLFSCFDLFSSFRMIFLRALFTFFDWDRTKEWKD